MFTCFAAPSQLDFSSCQQVFNDWILCISSGTFMLKPVCKQETIKTRLSLLNLNLPAHLANLTTEGLGHSLSSSETQHSNLICAICSCCSCSCHHSVQYTQQPRNHWQSVSMRTYDISRYHTSHWFHRKWNWKFYVKISWDLIYFILKCQCLLSPFMISHIECTLKKFNNKCYLILNMINLFFPEFG